MLKKWRLLIALSLVFIILLGFNYIVNADMGPKPSITIHLENMNTTNYTIDLLTKMGKDSYDKILEEYQEYKNSPIHKYNEDGWMATKLRNSILWGDVKGNINKTHSFTYFGVPDEFKVIIQYKDGTLKVSDTIKRTEFNYTLYLDTNTMEVTEGHKIDVLNILVCVLITIIVEVAIALIMKIHKINVIILTNIITQILIQSIRFANYGILLLFTAAELLVFFIEYIVYKKAFKDIENKRILIYTLAANLTTAALTLIIK